MPDIKIIELNTKIINRNICCNTIDIISIVEFICICSIQFKIKYNVFQNANNRINAQSMFQSQISMIEKQIKKYENRIYKKMK